MRTTGLGTTGLATRAWIVLLGTACALLPLLLVGLAVGLGGAPSVSGWNAGGSGGCWSPSAPRDGADHGPLHLLALSPVVLQTATNRGVDGTDGFTSARASTSSVRLPLRI